MRNQFIIIMSILFSIYGCRMPADPEGLSVVKYIGPINTFGDCLDLDVNDSIIVAATNFNGFMIFDIYDSLGRFNPQKKYKGSDFDPSVANNQISKIRISEAPPSIVMMDKYDRIYVNRLDGSPIFYIGGGVNNEVCTGAVWTDFTLNEEGSSLRVFTIVDNNLATEYPVDAYSKSIIWQNWEDFSHFPTADKISSIGGCEYSVNLFDEAEHIHFSSDGLLSVGMGELGARVYRQLNENTCFKKNSNASYENEFYLDVSNTGIVSGWPWSDRSIKSISNNDSSRTLVVLKMDNYPEKLFNLRFYSPEDSLIPMIYANDNNVEEPNRLWVEELGDYFYVNFSSELDIARFQFTIFGSSNISLNKNRYTIIEDFPSTNVFDVDKEKCENGLLLDGFGGEFEPLGGINLDPLIEFDAPGKVNSVYSIGNLLFLGLSNSNGLLVTTIDSNGLILDQELLAKGYSINNISLTTKFLGLAVGHDGVLIFEVENDKFSLKGRLPTGYANATKIKESTVYVATEDGIEIYVLK